MGGDSITNGTATTTSATQRAMKDPFAFFERALLGLGGLLGGAMVAGLLFATIPDITAGSATVGGDDVCVVAEAGAIGYVYIWGEVDTTDQDAARLIKELQDPAPDVADDVAMTTERVDLCGGDGSLSLRLLDLAHNFTGWIFALGFVAIAQRAINRARREGMFRRQVASGVARMGWYLGVGSLVSAAIEALANAAIIGRFVPGHFTFRAFYTSWDFPLPLLFVGIGLISVSRMLRYAAILQDDVEATV